MILLHFISDLSHNRFTIVKPINTQGFMLYLFVREHVQQRSISDRQTENMFCVSACDKQLSICSDYICLSTNSYCFVLKQRLNVFDRTFEASSINSYFCRHKCNEVYENTDAFRRWLCLYSHYYGCTTVWEKCSTRAAG